MSKELVIDVSSSEINIALLENKQLVELNKEKSNTNFSVGDIYLGKVKKIMPGLNAAFIDIGYNKDAFLHYLDLGPQFQSLNKFTHLALSNKQNAIFLPKFQLEQDINKEGKISDLLTVGQFILVQIAKEPISTKGPRLSSEISIAGRNLVLIPFSNKVSVSQKLSSAEERNRLKRLIQSIKPSNFGVIIRTVAEGKKVADLDSELQQLIKKWELTAKALKEAIPPKLIIGEINRTSAILRDMMNSSFNNIHVNDEDIYLQTKEFIKEITPDKEKIVKHYTGTSPIFEQFSIDKQIKALFGKTVPFKNGAYLIIEHTEALHVIDVNSGNRSKSDSTQETNALEINIAASEEIARQLRLRDMGGIIVVDFIDMHEQEHKQMLYDKMKDLMSTERAKNHILPLSKFGLMQITRQRVRPETNIDTNEKCPVCGGSGEISPSILFVDEIENSLRFLIEKYKNKTITLKVHPYVAAYLNKGLLSKQLKWCFKYKILITVKESVAYSFLEYHFFNKQKEEVIL